MKNRFQIIPSMFMTRFLFFFGLIASPYSFVNGQEKDIADIKKEYAQIRNHLKEYKIIKKEQIGESTEGGTLTAYFDDTLVRLIIEELLGESGKRITEYYYNNLNLFFIYDAVFTYNRPIYMDSAFAVSAGDNEWYDPSKTQKSEERFYFKNQSLIRWLDMNQKPMNLKSETSQNKEKEWVKRSARILSVFINTDQ